ncbi:MAG: tetratricopeptide repeat protein [Planctomycetota bacterium]|jgi:tetratricopeptide (TPR) repeat protein
MAFLCWFGAGVLLAATLSWLAIRKRDVLRLPWINLTACAILIAIAVFMAKSIRSISPGAAGVVGGATVGFIAAGAFVFLAAILSPYVVFLIVEMTGRAHRSLTGLDGMKVAKSYDRAEKLELERSFAEALAMYEAEAAADPGDAEARRRAGELCLKLDRPADAVRWLREAVALIEHAEHRVTLSFRLAEILDERLQKRGEARAVLEEIVHGHAGTRFAEFARERLNRLVQ